MSTATSPTQLEAARESQAADGGQTSQIVGFRLGNEEYGIDIMTVQEIILMGEITKIPEVADYISGLINLRGKVIPILELRKRFGLGSVEATEHTRIVVVNAGGTTFGITVDAVNEVLRIDPAQMEPPPQGLVGLEAAYIKGLVKMEEKIMILLNMESILSSEDEAAIQDNATPTG